MTERASVDAAEREGTVTAAGTTVHFAVHGTGGPTILLMPTWTIVHRRFWKLQVPYLARRHRVVTYDGPGNGLAERPQEPAAYDHERQVERALVVLEATQTPRAAVVALSRAAYWALDVAANHAEHVLGTVLIGPSVRLALSDRRERAPRGEPTALPASRVPWLGADPVEHWAKHHPDYWRESYEDFLWFFFGQCFPEPHSTKPIEDCVGWGRETTAEVLAAEAGGSLPPASTVREWCARIRSPLLAIHGEDDRVSSVERSSLITQLSGGRLVRIEGGGHLPLARDPVKVNHLLRDFVRTLEPAAAP